jgi:hypothetical protein
MKNFEIPQNIMALLKEAQQELAASLGKPGWTYHDLPRMSPEYVKQFFDLSGEENIQLITWADYGNTQRGQVLISPQGMKNLRKYNAQIHGF